MTAEELVVKITADADGLERELNSASKSVETFSKNTEDAGKDFDKLSKKAEAGSKTISTAMSALLTGITAAASAIGIAGIKFNASIETFQTSFETMTGSAEEAESIMGRLKDIAAETPFDLEGLAETTQLLMNYGLEGQEAIDMMKTMGDIAQGDSEKLNSVALAFGQMSSYGKVTLEDVKQMISAGFNPLQQIAEDTGESMESLYDRISKGTMSVDEIRTAMIKATSVGGKYFNSMQKQSKTLQGQWSTLKDTFAETSGKITKGISKWLADNALPKAIKLVEQLGENYEQIVPAVVSVTAAVASMKIAMNFTSIITSIQNVIAAFTATSGVIGILIASASLLIGAFASAAIEANQTSEAYKAFEEELENVNSKILTLQETHESYDLSLQDSINSYEAVSNQALNYVDRLAELEAKTNLTNDEQEEWKTLCEGLVTIMPELSNLIDTETYSIMGGTEALKANIEQWKERAYAEALTQRLTQAYMEQLEAEDALTNAQNLHDAELRKLSESYRESNELITQTTAITGENYSTVEEARLGLIAYREGIDNLSLSEMELHNSLLANRDAQEEQRQATLEANDSVKSAEKTLSNVNVTIDRTTDRLNIMGNKTEETAGKVDTSMNTIESATEDASESMSESIEKGTTQAQRSVESLRRNATNTINGMTQDWTYAGRNAANGVGVGIDSVSPYLRNKVSNLAASLNNAFKVKLKIQSPSKVMAESGRYVVQGIIVGIEEQEKFAKQMMGSLANTIETSFNPNLTIPDVSYKVNPVASDFTYNDWIGNIRQSKSNQNIVLQVDGKVLAETTCESINNLTAQTGSIPLRAF